jgi:hypothetical protein
MKCPICNTENTPDARACETCGFSLSLGQQVAWPELPRVEFPKPVEMPAWPETSVIEVAPVSSMFARAGGPAIGGAQAEIEPEAPPAGEPSSPQVQPSDDELAREHIARGFVAFKEGLLDQARWEFEQAYNLADSEDITRIAQSQLDALRTKAAAIVAPERLRPIRRPAPAPVPTPSLPQINADELRSALRVGLFAGLVAGFITAITGSAALCLGFLLGPAAGFVAGWLACGPNKRPGDVIPALFAGGVAGVGAAIGQWIGYPASVSSSTRAATESLQALSCMMGFVYIALAAVAGALGWRVRRQQKGQ